MLLLPLCKLTEPAPETLVLSIPTLLFKVLRSAVPVDRTTLRVDAVTVPLPLCEIVPEFAVSVITPAEDSSCCKLMSPPAKLLVKSLSPAPENSPFKTRLPPVTVKADPTATCTV